MASFFLFRKSFWLSIFRFLLSIFSLDLQGWCLIGIILCSLVHIHHDRDFWFQIWEYILYGLNQIRNGKMGYLKWEPFQLITENFQIPEYSENPEEFKRILHDLADKYETLEKQNEDQF